MELIRIGELARRSGVSVPTLKHYLREGLIAPVRKSGRTMAWYDPELAGKVKAIMRWFGQTVGRRTYEEAGRASDLHGAPDVSSVCDLRVNYRAETMWNAS